MSHITLFLFGNAGNLRTEFERTDDDEDAKYHLQEIVNSHSAFLDYSKPCFAHHVPLTKAEFDEWVETGHWSAKTEKLLKAKIKDFNRMSGELGPCVHEAISAEEYENRAD
jgi:hypothetical protein